MRFIGHHLDRLNFNRDRARKVRFFGPGKVEGRLLAPLRFRTKFDARYLYVFADKSNVRKSGPWSYPKKYPCTFTYIRVLSQDQSMPPKQSNEEIMNMSRASWKISARARRVFLDVFEGTNGPNFTLPINPINFANKPQLRRVVPEGGSFSRKRGSDA